jgi:hypothetical protein
MGFLSNASVPGGEAAICMAAHELLAFVMPTYTPQLLLAVVSHISSLALEVPKNYCASLKADEQLKQAKEGIRLRDQR